ncbi:MAG: TRAP transporter large permease [Syntrophomonadaceae bacterium]
MDTGSIGIILVVIFALCLLLGMRIGSLLLVLGVVGIYIIYGSRLSGILQNDPFTVVASYSLTPVPLFIFMAHCIMQANILDHIYYVTFKYSNGRPGIMGVITVFIGGFLGAVSGSGTAISAALTKTVSPQLLKCGFSKNLSVSTAAIGGSLAAVIPPSVNLIIYGSLTETSVGKLFMGALIPGLLLMLVYALCVALTYQIFEKPKADISRNVLLDEVSATIDLETIGMGKEINFKDTIIAFIMAIMLVIIVLGGIYTGVFTPTEAAAIATFISIIYCYLLKRLNWDFLRESLKNTLNITAMVMFIMVAAQIFGRFIAFIKLPAFIISLLNPILDKPMLILMLLMIIFFIIGMFLESIAGMVMAVPITLPLMDAAGIDPLWFGIMVGLLLCIGLVTPPIGMAVFSASGVSGVKLGAIFKYTMSWALIGFIIVGGLMILFPEIALWLPSHMTS